MTHYPYFVRGGVESFPGVTDESFNRYLTALRHGDAAFGDLMGALERAGELDDTLVIVLGDHGEAFLQARAAFARWSHLRRERARPARSDQPKTAATRAA